MDFCLRVELGVVMENARNRFRTDSILGDVMICSEAVVVTGDRQRSGIEALKRWR